MKKMSLWSLIVVSLMSIASCATSAPESSPTPTPLPAYYVPADETARAAKMAEFTNEWGNCVSYSPYRDGQTPGGSDQPTKAQILEDLIILTNHFKFIRGYDTGINAEKICQVIEENNLYIRYFPCAWVGKSDSDNAAQADTLIRLANTYTNAIAGVIVGNEALVSWSDHKVTTNVIIPLIQKVRKYTSVPVSCADNYGYWNSAIGAKVANEVDFVLMHTYPVWEKKSITQGLQYSILNYNAVKNRINKPIYIGEAGWCTVSGNTSSMLTNVTTEESQYRYFNEMTTWASNNNVFLFFFEAFDETWKGGSGADEPEKHWGLFFSDRTPKLAMHAWYADLVDISKIPTSNSGMESNAWIDQTSNNYVLYSETTVGGKPNTSSGWTTWDWTVTFTETNETYAEGTKSCRITPNLNKATWWGGCIQASQGENLTYYTNGFLVFSIKTTRTDPLNFGFQTGIWSMNTAVDCFVNINPADNTYGLVNDGNWHQVVIPMQDLIDAGVGADGTENGGIPMNPDFTYVEIAFGVKDTGTLDTAAFHIDNVYWTVTDPRL